MATKPRTNARYHHVHMPSLIIMFTCVNPSIGLRNCMNSGLMDGKEWKVGSISLCPSRQAVACKFFVCRNRMRLIFCVVAVVTLQRF